MPPASSCLCSGLIAAFKTTRDAFIEDAQEQALDAAWADGLALNFKENGMVERTRYGQHVEDEATDEATEIFDRILKIYTKHAQHFNPETDEYASIVEYALTMIDETQLSDGEQNALERITATHEAFLKRKKQIATQIEQQKQIEQRALAQFLLKSPLEFADQNSSSVLNEAEQQSFCELISKLRTLASV